MQKSRESGESSITILIAVAMVAGALLVAMSSYTGTLRNNRKMLAPPNICREAARNVIFAIRSNGVQAKSFRTPISRQSVFLNDPDWHRANGTPYNRGGVQSEVGAVTTLGGPRWPAVLAIDWRNGNGNYVSNTPRLIQGAVNGLLSMYHGSNRTACTLPEGVELQTASPLHPGAMIDMHNIKASVKIRPYDLVSGAVVACDPALAIRPIAASEPPETVTRTIASYAGYRADRGLEVEVFVEASPVRPETATPANESFKCSIKERFQFDEYRLKPPRPVVTVSNTSATFSMSGPSYAPGTLMVCRDDNASYPGDLNARATESVNGFGSSPPPRPPEGWVPCDRVTACGQPTTPSVDLANNSITVNYNIPFYCSVQISAMAFDPAGNTSDASNVVCYQGCSEGEPYDEPSSSQAPVGYQVGGFQFTDLSAAQAAARISGMSMVEISTVTRDMSAQMNSLAGGLNSITGQRDNATLAATNIGAAVAGLGAPGTTSAQAGAVVAQAQNAVNTASAAVASAQASLARMDGPAGQLGGIGKAAMEQAAAAVKAAEDALKAALEALERARQIEEEKRRQEEAEDDDDDDDP